MERQAGDLNERTLQCRKKSSCRAWIPASQTERGGSDGNQPICKEGFCPYEQEQKGILDLQIEVRRLKADIRDSKASAERALAKLESVQLALATALDIREIFDQGTIEPQEDPEKEEAAPILMISDIHCGMVVKPSAVNELGEFNPDIFDERMDAVAKNGLKVINGQRSTMSIREGIIWLGGDMIEGELHNDAVQNQELTTTQQIIRCQLALVRLFDYYLAHSDLERIIVPCNVGNHDRNTKKQQSNSTENSYAYLMYHNLRRHYRDQPRLQWQIADADCLYLNVYSKKLRFFHGDSVKYNGGQAGPLWNVMKHCRNLDQSIYADNSFHGHFHTLSFGRATGNGSLPGCAPYGHRQGYLPERPQQGMRILHSAKGFIGSFPIFTE